MALHRRTPKSNRHKKIKVTDPIMKAPVATGKNKKKTAIKDPPIEQTVPRRVRDILAAQNAPVAEKRKRKKKKNTRLSDDVIEGIARKGWEDDRHFLWRIQRETNDFIQEHEMKAKYDLLDSSIILGTEPQPDSSNKQRKKNKKSGIEDLDALIEPECSTNKNSASRIQQRSAQSSNVAKKSRRKRKRHEVDPLARKDKIRFGECVHAPPEISVLPRKIAKSEAARRPGQKDLLLKQLMVNSTTGPISMLDDRKRHLNDGTIKCDNPAKQRQLVDERNRTIEAYRLMKRSRNIAALT